MADVFISGAEKEGEAITFNKMKDVIALFKDISSITKLEERPVEGVSDAGQVVAVHFNNMNLTPTMMKEMEKIKNPQPEPIVKSAEVVEQQVESVVGEPIPVVEVEPQLVVETENVVTKTENGPTTDNTTPGYSGS